MATPQTTDGTYGTHGTHGGWDWNAVRPACHAVASAASNLSVLRSLSAFSCFALMQA
jgi:hypothetical protein